METQLHIFNQPARILVAGFSNSGKTFLVTNIIKKYHSNFSKIIYCGVSSHPLQCKYPDKVQIYLNLINPWLEIDESEKTLIVIDDLFLEAINDKNIADVFTKGRHANLSCILITQNLFFSGKYSRIISLNCTHYILHKQRDLNQVECLARQIYGKSRAGEVLEIYKYALSQRPYGYLLIDLATSETLQFRSHIVNETPFEIVYQWST